MKDKQQVKEFILTIAAIDNGNAVGILKYCYDKYKIRPKIDVWDPTSEKQPINYDDFIAWAEKDTPNSGDILFYPGTDGNCSVIAIVKYCTPEKVICAAALIGEQHLVCPIVFHSTTQNTEIGTKPEPEMPLAGFRPATEDEKIKLHKALSGVDLKWHNLSKKIVGKKVPGYNKVITATTFEGKIIIGILKEIKNDRVIMYCFKADRQPIKASLNEDIGHKSEFILDDARSEEKEFFEEELKKLGKVWNMQSRRLELINMRASYGQPYYYINSTLNVVKGIDKHTREDNARYNIGNYSTQESYMKENAQNFIQILKERMAMMEAN